MEFNSIPFLHDSFSSLCSHPLFSTIVTLYTLIFLYTPSLFLSIAFSPVFNSTGILLLSVLRLGANERSEKESGSSESGILDSNANQRPEKESGSLNSYQNHPSWLLIKEETILVESRFLDFVDQNQNPIEFESKTGLGSDSNQTHVEFKPKTLLNTGSNQAYMESELKTGLCTEFDQIHVDSKPKTDLDLKSNETHMEFEPNTSLGSESNQNHVVLGLESKPTTLLSTEPDEAHMEFELKTSLSTEFDQTDLDSKRKIDLDLKSNETHVESEPKTGLDSKSNQTHEESEPTPDARSESIAQDDYNNWEVLETIFMEDDPRTKTDSGSIKLYNDPFLEWNMRAPLEIIYEAYEGEEEEDDYDEEEEVRESNGNDDVSGEKRVVGPEIYPSLSMYYPESDTDSSSDGEFPVIGNWETQETVFLKWEEEEREELIEISLDRYGKKNIEFCHVEEDNLIEINIFPARS